VRLSIAAISDGARDAFEARSFSSGSMFCTDEREGRGQTEANSTFAFGLGAAS
jgi:hypothetical protein